MIGVIPSGPKTYEIAGDFNTDKPLVEGILYVQPDTKRLFYYSRKETRSSPATGYFPIWDGRRVYISNFSNMKYLSDACSTDMTAMSNNIDNAMANAVIYKQRRSVNDQLLKPAICDGDNMFTQCIKGVICAMDITMVDLIDMCNPKLPDKIIEGYYSALTKITFMRIDKWLIWLSTILHVNYVLDVYDGEKRLIQYKYPEETFDTGVVKYDDILNTKADAYKKIVKVLMVMKNITKSTLRSTDVDDYTINNMMTTLNGNKPLSAQLFSRFIRMADLSYIVKIYDGNKLLFEYTE